jgi:hypothetical protein
VVIEQGVNGWNGDVSRRFGMPSKGRLVQVQVVLTKILSVIGVALILAGVVVGFRSVSAEGTDCGSAFQPAAGITPMACDDRLDGAGVDVALLAGAGAIVGAAGITIRIVRDRRA